MSTTHLTPEHKTLVVALHAGAIAGSKIFDKDAKTRAQIGDGWCAFTNAKLTKRAREAGVVSVKCRVYHFKPRYTVSATINGTRYEAHVDRLGGHFMQVEYKTPAVHIQSRVLWFGTKSASKTWQERGYAMIAPQQTEDRGATIKAQADAVLARFAPVAQEPAPAAPVTEEPVTEEPAPLAPVALGASPAGVEWNVYPRANETRDAFEARVQVARERLAALHAKHAPAAPVTEEPERPARHRNALAHLAGLNDVVRDFLVDTYAIETGMRWHERDPYTWTERDARGCLATQYLEDLGYMPPRTCDTWEDVRALVREAYRLEALYA